MDDRASGPLPGGELTLAAVGALALTVERIDALADAISRRGMPASREEVRAVLHEQSEHWREEALRMGGHSLSWLSTLGGELGLVTRPEMDEIELRLAQLEHRLHLLEQDSPSE